VTLHARYEQTGAGPLSDVRIEIRTASAWRAANRSPMLRGLLDLLPAASVADASSPGDDSPALPGGVRPRRR
jgi:hypothetical protein